MIFLTIIRLVIFHAFSSKKIYSKGGYTSTIPKITSPKWCIKKESRDELTALLRKYSVKKLLDLKNQQTIAILFSSTPEKHQ